MSLLLALTGGVSPDATVAITGVSATGQAGTVTAKGDASVTITSSGATGAVGTTTQSGDGNVTITSSAATGQVGTTTQKGDGNVTITASGATGAVGTTTQAGDGNVTIVGSAGTGAAGDVVASGGTVVDVTIAITGVSATGAVGTTTQSGDANVSVTGVSATGYAGTVVATSANSQGGTFLLALHGTGGAGLVPVYESTPGIVRGRLKVNVKRTETEEEKRLRRESQGIIARAKVITPVEQPQLFEDAVDVVDQLKTEIAKLKVKELEFEVHNRRAEMIRAQLASEQLQMQVEEIDMAFCMFVMLAQMD